MKKALPLVATAVIFSGLLPVINWVVGGPSWVFELIFGLALSEASEVTIDVGMSVVLSILASTILIRLQLERARSSVVIDSAKVVRDLENVSSALEHIPEDAAAEIRRAIGGVLPANLLARKRDPVITAEIFSTAELIADVANKASPGELPIQACLLRGTRRRYKTMADGIHSNGSYMDPEERRELTVELATAQAAYSVLMNGVVDIRQSKTYGWNDQYIKFVRQIVEKHIAQTGWVFFYKGKPSPGDLAAAADPVKELGVPCFLLNLDEAAAHLAPAALAHMHGLGHLIEVFSAEFTVCLQGKGSFGGNAPVLWKATALEEVRNGMPRQISPIDKDVLPPGKNAWSDETIRKRVRAGSLAKADNLRSVLTYVLEARTAI